jgi:hypothetical protein
VSEEDTTTTIAVMMEAVRTSETSACFKTTWHYIPEGRISSNLTPSQLEISHSFHAVKVDNVKK